MKKVLKIFIWSISLGTIVFLLTAAKNEVEAQRMAKPIINMKVQDGISLLTEQELLDKLYLLGLFRDSIEKSALKMNEIETYLNELNEVQHAQVYTELDNRWYINVTTRRPIARIVLNNKEDFYIDDTYKLMKLSPYAKPKVIIFTGLDEIWDKNLELKQLINNDSLKTLLKLDQIYRISNYVCNDTFYNAQIVQINYDEKNDFVLVPRVGDNLIVFGEAKLEDAVKEKFRKLTTFYKEVIPYEGWNKYELINLKFENQIVAKKKE